MEERKFLIVLVVTYSAVVIFPASQLQEKNGELVKVRKKIAEQEIIIQELKNSK